MADEPESAGAAVADNPSPSPAPAPAAKEPAAAATGKARTIADPGAADDARPAVTGNLPDNWRDLMTGGDAEAQKQVARFQSPKAVWDSYRALQVKLSQAKTTLTPPAENAPPEEVAAWRTANGIPEAPEKYEPKLRDNRQLGEADKPVFTEFAQVAHKAGLSNQQMSQVIDWYLDQGEDFSSGVQGDDDAHLSQSIATLREEWGPSDFKRNVGAIHGLFDNVEDEVKLPDGSALTLKEALLTARMPNGKLVGGDAQALRFLAKLGLDLVPLDTQLPPGGSESSVKGRLEEIRALRRKDVDAYNADKKLQAEELRLIEIEQRHLGRGRAA